MTRTRFVETRFEDNHATALRNKWGQPNGLAQNSEPRDVWALVVLALAAVGIWLAV